MSGGFQAQSVCPVMKTADIISEAGASDILPTFIIDQNERRVLFQAVVEDALASPDPRLDGRGPVIAPFPLVTVQSGFTEDRVNERRIRSCPESDHGTERCVRLRLRQSVRDDAIIEKGNELLSIFLIPQGIKDFRDILFGTPDVFLVCIHGNIRLLRPFHELVQESQDSVSAVCDLLRPALSVFLCASHGVPVEGSKVIRQAADIQFQTDTAVIRVVSAVRPVSLPLRVSGLRNSAEVGFPIEVEAVPVETQLRLFQQTHTFFFFNSCI